MGGLHSGHGDLIRRASRFGPTLVSIFVNPLQFGPQEDFDCYPRSLTEDAALAETCGAAAVWSPDLGTIYPDGPEGQRRLIAPPELQRHLCGGCRPGHFDGVVTVMERLLKMVQPQQLWLGEKDWQQLIILRWLVADRGLPVQVRTAPTVRDRDGLPLSSRNLSLIHI